MAAERDSMAVLVAEGVQPLLSVRGISKAFGPVKAVDHIDLDIYPREVLGIIGDNGAGKSTFLQILAGYYQPDSGTIFYRGQPVSVKSPKDSRRHLKIEMIYQHLNLAPDLRVWENVFLAEERRTLGFLLARRDMIDATRRVLQELNAEFGPDDLLEELSGGERQVVAIARTLLFDRQLVIMDEPTAAISVNKVREVLQLIRKLKDEGKSVILVSHRLEDILEVADRIAVFSRGKVRTILDNIGDLTVDDLIHAMFA